MNDKNKDAVEAFVRTCDASGVTCGAPYEEGGEWRVQVESPGLQPGVCEVFAMVDGALQRRGYIDEADIAQDGA